MLNQMAIYGAEEYIILSQLVSLERVSEHPAIVHVLDTDA